MLKTREAGRVESGYYWDLARWTILTIPKEGGVLPGGPERRYLRVPLPLLLVVAPTMGGLYVLFLPFIGFVMLAHAAGTVLARALGRALAGVAATLAPAWRPGEAYFAGRHGGDAGEPAAERAKETHGETGDAERS